MKRKIFIAVLFSLIVICLIAAVPWGWRVYQDIRLLRGLAQEAKALKAQGLNLESMPQVYQMTTRAVEYTGNLQRDFKPLYPALRRIGFVPFAGHYLVQVEPLLDYASSLSQAGVELEEATKPLWQNGRLDLGEETFDTVLQILDEKKESLTRAETLIQQADAARAQIDFDSLPVNYRDNLKEINDYVFLIPHALKVMRDIPGLLALAEEAKDLKSLKIRMDNIGQIYDLAVRASDQIGNLRRDVEPLYPLFQKISAQGVEPSLSQVEPILEYAANLSQAGVLMGEAFKPLWQKDGSSDTKTSQLEKISALLSEKQLNFSQAEELINNASLARGKIDKELLPGNARSVYQDVDAFFPTFQQAINILQIAPRVLGSKKQQTYLIMVQNRDELRASGGFASAFGLLRLKDGRVSILGIEDSSRMDYVREVRKPPEPIAYIMQANYLVARDANWSPDFPTAAQQTQEMYYLSKEIPTNGVIAFDQGLMVSVLDFLGPVTIPGDSEPINAGNIEEKMIHYKQSAIAAGNVTERKEFMSVLAPYLMQKVNEVTQPERQIELIKLVFELIQSGHLGIYFNDPDMQKVLHQYNLDGAVNPGNGDYVMMVDSNLGISKVDLFIDRSLDYKVDFQDPQNPRATIRLKYHLTREGTEPCHQGVSLVPQDVNEGYYFVRCYWDYWRVLLMKDTILEKAVFDPVPADYFDDGIGWKNEVKTSEGENGTQMLEGLTVVPQGEIKEVTLKTRLPSRVFQEPSEKGFGYSLRIQKQAGIAKLPVTLQITAPDGYVLSMPAEGWTAGSEKYTYTWAGELTKTQDFQLKFVKAE